MNSANKHSHSSRTIAANLHYANSQRCNETTEYPYFPIFVGGALFPLFVVETPGWRHSWNDDNDDSNRIQFRNYSINKVLIASSANKFMATPFYLADISWILSIVLLVSVEMETLFLPFCQRKKSHIQEKEPWASSNSEKCGKQDFKWHKRRSEYTKRNAKSSMENNV